MPAPPRAWRSLWRFGRSSIVVLAFAAVAALLNYAYQIVAARELSAADFGALATLLGVYAAVAVPLTCIEVAVARGGGRPPGDAASSARLRRAALAMGLLAGAVVAAVLSLGGLDVPWEATLIAAAGIAIYPLSLLRTGWLQSRQRFAHLGITIAIGNAVKLGAALAALWMGFGLVGAVAGAMVGSAAMVLAARPRAGRWHAPQEAAADALRYLTHAGVVLALMGLMLNLDIVLVRRLFPAEESGAYAALMLFGRLILFAAAPVAAVLLPMGSAWRAEGRDPRPLLYLAIGGVVATALVGAAAMAPFAPILVRLVLGEAYVAHASLAPIGFAAMGFLGALQLATSFLLPQRPRDLALVLAAALVMFLALAGTFHGSLALVAIEIAACAAAALSVLVILAARGDGDAAQRPRPEGQDA